MTDGLKDRRWILAGGAGLALAAGLVIAAIMAGRPRGPSAAPPASQGGLVVQTGRDDDIKLDPGRPLRCFVGGQFIGDLPLSACAKRNGVAAGALDVGLDPSGALAAANGVSSDITPLPPNPEPAGPAVAAPAIAPPALIAEDADNNAPAGPRSATAPCWRYIGAGWRRLPWEVSLNACVRLLYAGRCERAGGAAYGRWADRTLRLVPGRVEISDDNRRFRTLFEQGPECAGQDPG